MYEFRLDMKFIDSENQGAVRSSQPQLYIEPTLFCSV